MRISLALLLGCMVAPLCGAARGVYIRSVSEELDPRGELHWVYVPEHSNFVLARKNQDHGLIYVHPDASRLALPKGLYVWRNKLQRYRGPAGRRVLPVFMVKSERRFFWDPGTGSYVSYFNRNIGDSYNPAKAQFRDPSPSVAFFREKLKDELARKQRKPHPRRASSPRDYDAGYGYDYDPDAEASGAEEKEDFAYREDVEDTPPFGAEEKPELSPEERELKRKIDEETEEFKGDLEKLKSTSEKKEKRDLWKQLARKWHPDKVDESKWWKGIGAGTKNYIAAEKRFTEHFKQINDSR